MVGVYACAGGYRICEEGKGREGEFADMETGCMCAGCKIGIWEWREMLDIRVGECEVDWDRGERCCRAEEAVELGDNIEWVWECERDLEYGGREKDG